MSASTRLYVYYPSTYELFWNYYLLEPGRKFYESQPTVILSHLPENHFSHIYTGSNFFLPIMPQIFPFLCAAKNG